MKNAYVIKEVQNLNSDREGVSIRANSLSCAKRTASRNQGFHGTTLKIETENGALLAYKEPDQKWVEIL